MRILLDHNVPAGARTLLAKHEVYTVVEMGWPPQLENGELLKAAEAATFEILLASDQNIPFQQNLAGLRLALVVLGSNIWPIVQKFAADIATSVDKAKPGTCHFIEMPLPGKPPK